MEAFIKLTYMVKSKDGGERRYFSSTWTVISRIFTQSFWCPIVLLCVAQSSLDTMTFSSHGVNCEKALLVPHSPKICTCGLPHRSTPINWPLQTLFYALTIISIVKYSLVPFSIFPSKLIILCYSHTKMYIIRHGSQIYKESNPAKASVSSPVILRWL